MSDLWSAFLGAGLLTLACVTALWLLSLSLANASIIDIYWGLGFVLANGAYHLLLPGGDPLRKSLLTALVTIWGLRLALHILRRNWGKPEDYRYQAWREANGAIWWWKSYLQVFLLQGALLWMISTPLLAAHAAIQPVGLTWLDAAGAAVWLVGFIFEAGGDWQLARFRADPANRGKVMQSGLWRYTRHPNYFGDALQWWGFFLIALGVPGGWLTVFSPLLMTFLLTRVSGAALLEQNLRQKPGFAEYTRRTSAFIPWFPKVDSGE
jgi:steroid 5-alpha reductase family enzyme